MAEKVKHIVPYICSRKDEQYMLYNSVDQLNTIEIIYKLDKIVDLLTPISEYCKRQIDKEDNNK